VLKANASAHIIESAWCRCCTGSASLNAAQYLYKNYKPEVLAH